MGEITGESWRTFARITGDGIVTDAAIATGTRNTIVNVDLASGAGKAFRTGAFEGIYEILTDTTIQAGLVFAFVYVDFALCSGITYKNIN